MKKECHLMNRSSQSGAVLIVGLVMVLLISIIALSAIRSSNLQEAMAGNMRDRNIAFQASESGLVVGESDVNIFEAAPICTGRTNCYLRQTQVPSESVIFLTDAEFDDVSRLSELVLKGVESEPTFMIEELSPFTPQDGSALEKGAGLTDLLPYRITSKGTGLGANTTVILQTTYNRFANAE
jgi:type IV pilus assembly protein PilX